MKYLENPRDVLKKNPGIDIDDYTRKFVQYSHFGNNENWTFADDTGYSKTIKAMYYALTTISTVGFGDLYPITDFERGLCSFMLVIGVLLFSYVLS